MMPDLDGWTVLAAIKGDPALADIPVVLMTIVDEKNRGYALGAADYLVKPVDRERLVGVLRSICGAARTRRAGRRRRRCAARAACGSALEPTAGRSPRRRTAASRSSALAAGAARRDHARPDDAGDGRLRVPRRSCAARAEWRDIPVVVVTAKDLTDEDRDRLNGGVERILQKSAIAHELLREVCAQLGEMRRRGRHDADGGVA